MTKRLVLFGRSGSFISNALVSGVIDACRRRHDFEVVAVFATGRPDVGLARRIATPIARRMFDDAHPVVLHPPILQTFERSARRAGIPVFHSMRVNDPAFVSWLACDLRPDCALSLICLQIFRAELLHALRYPVNYHNGALPAYRGLQATNWSIYNQEVTTGFTFHRMTEGIDEGPVLVEGSVPIAPAASPLQVEWDKTVVARASLDRVLDAIAREDAGTGQSGTPGYYSHADAIRIRGVGDPSRITWDDLTRRIRAFNDVRLSVGGRELRVTKVRPGSGGFATFRTIDGVGGRVARVSYLPPRIGARIRRVV